MHHIKFFFKFMQMHPCNQRNWEINRYFSFYWIDSQEIFELIVATFENLSDTSSRSYPKRVSILETVAKVRSCVVMLDLECDSLIIKMFKHFLGTIRWELNYGARMYTCPFIYYYPYYYSFGSFFMCGRKETSWYIAMGILISVTLFSYRCLWKRSCLLWMFIYSGFHDVDVFFQKICLNLGR